MKIDDFKADYQDTLEEKQSYMMRLINVEMLLMTREVRLMLIENFLTMKSYSRLILKILLKA